MEKYKIVRSDSAKSDLKEITLYIAINNSIEVALNMNDKFKEAIMQLEDMPFSGCPEKFTYKKAPNYRYLIVDKYLVHYHTDANTRTVYIDRIKHGFMAPENQF